MTENLPTCELTFPLGQIKGVKRLTLYDEDYYSFEGVPFARPPLGELRFKAPQPVEPWSGVLDCTKYAQKPAQVDFISKKMHVEGAEDCLYLNVYAKQLKTEKPLPVMVYIYGGGFNVGGATTSIYGPDYFMAKDVILVTFNYRLDSLGFLSLKDPSLNVPGNAGLKDQVLALRWIKQYISHFNGDAHNITLFGNCAGGASTHYMMLTEQTRGLFHKAIFMSGTVHNPWAITKPSDFAYRLAKLNGFTGDNNDSEILKFLQKVPASKLVNSSLLTTEDNKNGALLAFGPIIEPYVGEDCVVPKPPLEMTQEAWSNEIPAMLGGTSFEGLYFYTRALANLDLVAKDPLSLVPYDVRVANTKEQNLILSQKLYQLHFAGVTSRAEMLMNFLEFYSYRVFWHGYDRALQARLTHAVAPTFFYRFDFDSPNFNFYRKKFCGDKIKQGVAHVDDLCYLFRNAKSWKLNKSSMEYRTIERMVGIWTAFAATSNPNCKEISEVDWQPSTKERPQLVLNISNEVKLIDLPEYEKLQVWTSIHPQKINKKVDQARL